MKGNAKRFMRFSAVLVGLVTLAWALALQGAKPAQHRTPLPTDWSHRHLIFSQPATPQQRARVESEPRYWQQMRRGSLRLAPPTHAHETSALGRFGLHAPGKFQRRRKIHRDWAETMGSLATVGAGNFPAKLTFDITTASCDSDPQPDFVVFSTGLQSSGTQASIVAFDNLYSGCTSGTVPMPYFAYDTTGTAPGTIRTSPVPSLDGSQIAFVQTDGSGHGTLVLLRWAATLETFDAPGAPTLVPAPSSYPGCTAPCMTMFDLRSGLNTQTDDTTSSVFYDYTGDIAWVGDSQGWLHKFTGVFLGTPAEVRTGGFPVQMPAGGLPLSSPVFDRISQTVFVGDYGGFLNRVDATTAAVTQSGQLDFGTGIVDAPMVDVTRGQVYVSSSDDGSGGCTSGADCAAVVQLSASFAAGDTGTGTALGTSTFTGTPLPNPLYDGTVDNAFLNSANATGNLYVCGNTGANPILYVVPIQAGALGIPAVLSTLATNGTNPACSPVTDISAPGATAGSAATEHLFVSVQNNSTTCGSGGCIQNLVDTPWQASTSFTVGQEILVKGSSSAVRYINVVITAGTSGTTQPSWPNTSGVTRADGSVVWLNQGNTTTPINLWQASHSYTVVGGRVFDGNNVQVVRTTVAPHLSGGTAPTWNTTPGGFTADNNISWVNAGPLPTAALASTGGTSGIIIDNVVDPGTFAGASQVYFSTLADQNCATSGVIGGCAVQASQSALQ
jgi:hypothetical protein